MAVASHLSSGRIDVSMIRDAARRFFLDLLDKCEGTKALAWDQSMTGPFGLIAEYSVLKERGVTKMTIIQQNTPPADTEQHVIFLVGPKVDVMQHIADCILSEERRARGRDYSIIFVPRRTLLCDRKLEELGVKGSFTNIFECPIDVYPVDSDVLSMELPLAFRECYLEGDLTSMYYVARSLIFLQSLYGIIPRIYGKGQCARQVADIMLRMRKEIARDCEMVAPEFDSVILLDRNVDLLSPLLTQLTYEGLLDELFGIQNASIKFSADKFSDQSGGRGGQPQQQESSMKTIKLNSSDDLYAEIRDLNFYAVGPLLNRKAKHIREAFEERHGAKTVGQIKQFVSKLPHIQGARLSLSTYTTVTALLKEKIEASEFIDRVSMEQDVFRAADVDRIHPFVEQLLNQHAPLADVLRLICAQCTASNGFKQKVYDFYRREIIQTYGFEHVRTLERLEEAGLFRLHGPKVYNTIRKTMRLTVEDINEQNPDDLSYVHSGYAPLTARLVQCLTKPEKWRGLEEMLKLVPGPTIDERQKLHPGIEKRQGISPPSGTYDNPRLILVVFLGGCTFAEISALRFLAQQEEGQTDFVIATTKLLNGKTLLETLIEPPPKSPMETR
ncbi:vacuolar protein sorting-associated protein 33A-like [Oscarella lobularis]|uniref:vacuolar protein sorting-associated protein 33A-like n=1 Tax=Oscarella lobularis TaxID=121494 RepID=UPI003313FEEC